jgi:hypothetical protein
MLKSHARSQAWVIKTLSFWPAMALHFRPHMKHVVSGGADSAVLLWSLHCRPNLRHPVVRPYRFLGHQVIILPQFCNPLSNYQMIISHETRN